MVDQMNYVNLKEIEKPADLNLTGFIRPFREI